MNLFADIFTQYIPCRSQVNNLAVGGLLYTTALRDNFPRFACWGDLILSEFQNQLCACSAQPLQKCESSSMFNTKMPEALRVRDYIIVRGTDTIF